MKVGIIGSGNMGRTLGLTWMEKGHSVFFGSRTMRDIDFIREVYSGDIQHGSIREAISFGDVLLYSLRDTLPSAIAPRDAWNGKIILDCNNGSIPADFNYAVSQQSFTEKYQQDVPGSKVVKAFNTNAQELFDHDLATLQQAGIIGLMAGDDDGAKQIVAVLLRDAGLVPLDAGRACNARQLESFADLVRMLMIRNKLGPYLVFKTEVLAPPAAGRNGGRKPSSYH